MLPLIMSVLITTKFQRDHKSILDSTLLGEYIKEKMDTYVEPERKGTAKGEEIGFSRVKYQASLYGITKVKQKYVAELLGVSHGVIRKWRTETSFKKMTEKHCREFAQIFHNYIEQLVADELHFQEVGRPKDEDYELYLTEYHQNVDDGDVYGSQLCDNIKDVLEKKMAEIEEHKKQNIADPYDDVYLDIVKRVLRWSNVNLGARHGLLKKISNTIAREKKEHLDSLREQGVPVIENPVALFRKILACEHLSDEERKQAITLLEQHLEILKSGCQFIM